MDALLANLSAEAPHLATLMRQGGKTKRGVKGSHLPDHPLVDLLGARRSWPLKSFDRAVAIIDPILGRCDRRSRFASRLWDGSQFTPAVAELFAGARMARITSAPETMLVDPQEGGPDLQFDLAARRIYAEVYAPKSWRELDIIDDIRERMRGYRSCCRFQLMFTQPVARRSDLAKRIANNLKEIAERVAAAEAQVATFFSPTLVDRWTTFIDSVEEVAAENALIGWAHRDDYNERTVVFGSIDSKYVSVETEARDALSDLSQLVEHASNLLIVDLSGRSMDAFTLKTFEEAAAAAGARHPELSAVLLTGRSCRLRPHPSTEFESCAWYRTIPNPGSTTPFSGEELAVLETPGLIVPGFALASPSQVSSGSMKSNQGIIGVR